MILYGKDFAAKIKAQVRDELKNLSVVPCLAVIIVGDNPASQVYVRNKQRVCDELEIVSKIISLPETTSREKLLQTIDELNQDENVHGLFVQLPLPKALRSCESEVLERISPKKDVDGFHPVNVGRLSIGKVGLVPCTPLGILTMLQMEHVNLDGANVVIVGRSNIVGKPMAQLCLSQNATVTICHSHTKNLEAITKNADVLIVAIGHAKFIKASMVKKGAVVVDVGINRDENNKLTGDVDFEEVKEIASKITPVPGGVGLLTTATLAKNLVTAIKWQLQGENENA